MLFANQRLQKKSHAVFQVLRPPEEEDKRPLEWRRSFVTLNLPLKKITISEFLTVNEIDFSLDADIDPKKLVRALVTERRVIEAKVDAEGLRDTLAVLLADKGDDGIFSFHTPEDEIVVRLQAGESQEVDVGTKERAFIGSARFLNFHPNEDGIRIELTAPQEHLEKIILALKEDDTTNVMLQVELLSFTYEVEDALKEWHQPSNIAMLEHTSCFLSSIFFDKKIGSHTQRTRNQAHDSRADLQPKGQEGASLAPRSLPSTAISSALSSLVKAAWMAIFLALIFIFFKS